MGDDGHADADGVMDENDGDDGQAAPFPLRLERLAWLLAR